jgi:hypothetical protein
MTESESSPSSRLAAEWRLIANALGLRLIAPASILLPSGDRVNADALLLDFGGPKGMVLVTDYKIIRPYRDTLPEAGYGFSVLSDPTSTEIEIPPQLDDIIDVLRDWGWAGAPENEPTWLRAK